jgi:hypothetical protein
VNEYAWVFLAQNFPKNFLKDESKKVQSVLMFVQFPQALEFSVLSAVPIASFLE